MDALFNVHDFAGKTVAVATSGGADSMSLLYYMKNLPQKYRISVICLNVEHGIRGESSLKDTQFVKDYCEKNGIPFLGYSVDAPKKAEEERLSVEQAARILRYECFFNAIDGGKCDAVFTAHHVSDDFESILINLFRGTGIKGLIGIKNYGDRIVRPFLTVKKSDIYEYAKEHGIPFVTDETNLSDDYTRNFLRHNVVPHILEIFPEAEKSALRLAQTLSAENEYLEKKTREIITETDGGVKIKLPADRAIVSRAVIEALKILGVKRDYEKVHADDVCALCEKQTGKKISLPVGITAVKEYDGVFLYRSEKKELREYPFCAGEIEIAGRRIRITETKRGGKKLYFDADKIPKGAVIRTRRTGDRFTKFGGGTKSLSDYLTDKKVLAREREMPLIAFGREVFVICGLAVSDKVKVDETTENVFTVE